MAVDRSALPKGTEFVPLVIERQLCYFSDPGNFDAFLRYIDKESPWREVFEEHKASIDEEDLRKPFALW